MCCRAAIARSAFHACLIVVPTSGPAGARRARPAKRLGISEVWSRGAQGALPPGPLLSSGGGHKWHISTTATDTTTTTPVNASIVIRSKRSAPGTVPGYGANAGLCNLDARFQTPRRAQSPGKRSFAGKTSGTPARPLLHSRYLLGSGPTVLRRARFAAPLPHAISHFPTT
jgi:hypothetical protein